MKHPSPTDLVHFEQDTEWSEVRSRPATATTPLERSAQLERKLQIAQRCLREETANSRELQLLGIAILRRDEALLDELLSRLGAAPDGAR